MAANTMLRPRVSRRLLQTEHGEDPPMKPVTVSLDILEHIVAQIDNTPTLAVFLRTNRTTYGIARKYLYHTVELGGNGSKPPENDMKLFLAGLEPRSSTKMECLGLVRTVFVKCKIFLTLSPSLRSNLFPNLDTLVLPSFACQTFPVAFSLDIFQNVKHLIVNDFVVGPALIAPQYIGTGQVDVSHWRSLKKISLSNLSDRYRSTAEQKFVVPEDWRALEEIVIWPSFDGISQNTRLDPFRYFPDLSKFPRFDSLTVMISEHDEEECINEYAPLVHKLSEKERSMVRYAKARSIARTRRDPIMEEESAYRDWV